MADGNIELEVDAQPADAILGIEKMVESLRRAVIEARRLRNEFIGLDNSAIKKKLAEFKINSGSEQAAKTYIQSQSSPNGGQYRDDQLKNFALKSTITSLNTSNSQIEAQLREAANKAAERLLRTTAAGLAAKLNQTDLSETFRTMNFGTAEGLDVQRTKKFIQYQRDQRLYSGVSNLDELEAKKRAQREADLAEAKRRREEEAAKKRAQREADLAEAKNRREEGAAKKASTRQVDLFSQRVERASDYATFAAGVFAIQQTFTALAQLEDQLKKFQAITQTSNLEMVQFKQSLLGIGEASRYSLNDLADAATVIGQTGLSAEGVTKALSPISQLATAAGTDLKSAVDVVTSVLGAFNLQATQSGDVANVLTGALNRTKLTMEQLALGVQYSANIARENGISFTELTAVLGGLAQAGIRSGSTIGTGVRQLIQELSAPSEKLRDTMKALGITLADIDLKSNGLVGALENLKSRGFGSAEALRTLDLRAAAAFTALGGQANAIKSLNEQLLLTDSASEGAAVANESLLAVYQRLSNTLTFLADSAFGPTLTAITGIGQALGNAASGLTSATGTLKVFGTVLSGIVIALPLRYISGLAAGLFGISAAATTATASVGALATASRFLVTTPFGLVLTTIAGISATYFATIAARSDALLDKIDKVNAALNELQNARQTTETSISAINQQITGLLDRREKLNSDPILRRTAVIEAQKAFGELGLQIDANVGSVDKLVEALSKLRAELAKKLPGDIAAQIDDLAEKSRLLLEKSSRSDPDRLSRIGRRPYFIGSSSDQLDFLTRSTQGLTGKNFRDVFEFIAKDSRKINVNDVRGQVGGFQSELQKTRDEIRTELNTLSNKSLSGNLTYGEERRRTTLTEAYDRIGKTIDELNSKVRELSNIQSIKIDEEQKRREQPQAVIQATPEFQGFTDQLKTLLGDFDTKLNSINGDKAISERARADQIRGLRDTTATQATALADQVNAYRNRLVSSGESKDAVDNALRSLVDDIENIKNGTVQRLLDIQEAVRQSLQVRFKADQKANKADLDRLLNRLKIATSAGDVDLLGAQVKAAMDREREISLALLQAGSKNPDKLDPEEQQAIISINEEADNRWAEYVDKATERKRQITERLLAFDEAVLKSQRGAIEAEIDRVRKELNQPGTTVDKAKELRDRINMLMDQAKAIFDRELNIDTQKELLSKTSQTSTSVLSSNAGSVAQQISALLNQSGNSSLLPYLLATGQRESGLNPKAASNTSSAKGLFQFIDQTWTSFGQGRSQFDISAQVAAVLQLTQENEKAFQKILNRAPTDPERYLLHQQGAAGGIGLLQNPNALATDVVGRKAVLNNGGTLTTTAGEFAKRIMDMFETSFEQIKGQIVSSEDLIRQKADAERSTREIEDRTKRAADQITLDQKAYQAQVLLDRQRNAGDERSIATSRRTLASTISPEDAQKAAVEILGSLKGLFDRAKQEYQADPTNVEKTPQQRQADVADIKRQFTERAQKEILNSSSVVAQKIIDAQQRVVDDLKLLREQQDKNPAKFSGTEITQTQAKLDFEEQRLQIATQLVAKEEELASIRNQIEVGTRLGLLDEGQIADLKQRQVDLDKEKLRLAERLKIKKNAEQREPTIGNAISGGTADFFQRNGFLVQEKNAVRFRSTLEDMQGYWSQAMQGMQSSMSQLFTNLLSGTMKAKDAFKQFASSIIQNMLQIASQALANNILKSIFGNLSGVAGTPGSSGGGFSRWFSGLVGTASTGAYVTPRRMALGGAAGQNRDSVPYLLMPGEMVLRKSAVDQIGRKSLDDLNALGNSAIDRSRPAPVNEKKPGQNNNGMVNVWVVSPDQVPPPSAKDIIAVISQDIQNKGTVRQLIKNVALGGG